MRSQGKPLLTKLQTQRQRESQFTGAETHQQNPLWEPVPGQGSWTVINAQLEAQCGQGWAFRLQEGPAFLSLPSPGSAWSSWWASEKNPLVFPAHVTKQIFFYFRKMVMITLYARQQKRHRCIEQSFGQSRFNSRSLAREAERKYYLGGLLLDHTVSSPLGSASVYLPVRFCCCRCGCSTYKTVWDAWIGPLSLYLDFCPWILSGSNWSKLFPIEIQAMIFQKPFQRVWSFLWEEKWSGNRELPLSSGVKSVSVSHSLIVYSQLEILNIPPGAQDGCESRLALIFSCNPGDRLGIVH